jgi:hypothetical protein
MLLSSAALADAGRVINDVAGGSRGRTKGPVAARLPPERRGGARPGYVT